MLHRYGSFRRTPFDQTSKELIIEMRKEGYEKGWQALITHSESKKGGPLDLKNGKQQ